MALRILHCIPTLSGYGSQTQLVYLARQQVLDGLDVHVVSGRGGESAALLIQAGATLHELAPVGNYDVRRIAQMRGLIRRIAPTIIQTWLLQMDVVGGIAALWTRTPWLLSERSSAGNYRNRAKQVLRRAIARGVSGIVSNSSGGDAYWRRHAPQRRWIIPNIVPAAEIARCPGVEKQVLLSGDDRKMILWVGRFASVKNYVRLIGALGLAASRRPITAFLLGEGPDFEDAARRVREAGLSDSVRVVGRREDAWSWMKTADAFVSVSLAEGMPNAVLEAMAAGCPIVLSDIPAHRALAGEDEAIFVDPLSEEAIADGILRGLTDSGAARERARRAQLAVGSLSASHAAASYHRVYEALLERGGAA